MRRKYMYIDVLREADRQGCEISAILAFKAQPNLFPSLSDGGYFVRDMALSFETESIFPHGHVTRARIHGCTTITIL